jgi:creatinine amidohydrolase
VATVPARSVLWQKCRRDDIRAAASAGAVALLPLGAVEQHGPHLPLDTDSVTAFEISVRAAGLVDHPPVLVLPPVWWGLSPYWMGFPGTLSLRPETLIELLADLCASVGHHGLRRLAIVNGHGGNAGLVQAAAIKATRDGLRVAALSYWDLIPGRLRELSERDGGSIGHAGELETSLQLHLQPERVDLARVREDQCLDVTAPGVEPAGVYLPPDPAAESPHGVYGMARAGSAEKGARILEAAAQALAGFVRQLAAGPSPPR